MSFNQTIKIFNKCFIFFSVLESENSEEQNYSKYNYDKWNLNVNEINGVLKKSFNILIRNKPHIRVNNIIL